MMDNNLLDELYQYADGNDDILSDMGNTEEVRYRMPAYQPATVSDYGINELTDKIITQLKEFGGTALRSKTNTIGGDDFPSYNQNDTSPLTDNNIPRNINDDLEYNHVDDATKDKYILGEVTKGG